MMYMNSFGLNVGNQMNGWNPLWGGRFTDPAQDPKSDARPPMLICIGFGSRGGFRETGVVRKDEPMEKPTASTPIWPSQPVAGERKQEEPSQSIPRVKAKIQ
jgi:hypothetical protein